MHHTIPREKVQSIINSDNLLWRGVSIVSVHNIIIWDELFSILTLYRWNCCVRLFVLAMPSGSLLHRNSKRKNTGAVLRFFSEIFPARDLPHLLHWQEILFPTNPSPKIQQINTSKNNIFSNLVILTHDSLGQTVLILADLPPLTRPFHWFVSEQNFQPQFLKFPLPLNSKEFPT